MPDIQPTFTLDIRFRHMGPSHHFELVAMALARGAAARAQAKQEQEEHMREGEAQPEEATRATPGMRMR